MSEKISSLFDNELNDQERERALAKLRPGSEELAAWERYARIRAELRGEMPETDGFASGAIADRISAVLREEPTQFVPGGVSARADDVETPDDAVAQADADTAPTAQAANDSFWQRSGVRWAGAFAIAASVAAVSLLGPSQVVTEDPASTPQVAAVDTAQSPAVAAVSTATTTTTTGLAPVAWKQSGTGWEQNNARHTEDNARRLNALLVAHAEFSPAASMNGMAAYARFVSYDPTRDEG